MAGEIPEAYLSELSAFVAATMGLHFPRERWRDLSLRLGAAARELNFPDGRSCIEWLLSASPTRSQIETLASHLTVGETYFFRDKQVFALLEEQVLPDLIRSRRGKGKVLRIWSAGCATGEEPYSIAILLSRMIPDLQDWNITILATDINSRFLEKARIGRYRPWSFRDTPPRVLDRFFERADDERFEVLSRIRQMVSFAYLNLAEDSYPSLANHTNAMDIVFCRNVLMYFVPELARKVATKLHRSIVEGGFLIAGPSESTQLLFSQFAALRHPGSIIFRKERLSSTGPCGAPERKAVLPPHSVHLPKAGQTAGVPAPAATLPPAASPQVRPVPEPSAPELGEDRYREAFRLYTEGCYAEAADVVAHLIAQQPSDAQGPALLARIHANWGRLGDALGWCEKAIAAEKLNPGLHYLLATILRELGRMEEATVSLKRTLFLEPEFVMAYVALGTIAQQFGRHEESVRHFGNALGLLAKRSPEEVPDEADGMNAARLIEIVRAMQQAEGGEVLE